MLLAEPARSGPCDTDVLSRVRWRLDGRGTTEKRKGLNLDRPRN